MRKIIIRNTSIIINDYNFGDVPKLENFFAIYNPTYHMNRYVGIYYDQQNKRLFLPRGIDIWYVEQLLNEEAYVEKDTHSEYHIHNDIGLKYAPRDEDQIEALRFTIGTGKYLGNRLKSQLSLNLGTGKGKTYVAIATVATLRIKSIIITYSDSILNQWRDRILEYTNIKEKEIYKIKGKGSIFRLLQKKNKEIKNIKIFLVSHSTLQRYGDNQGWDKVTELFEYIKVGLKLYDESHLVFNTMCMIDYYTNIYKTYYLTATPGRSNEDENKIYQTSFKNIPSITLFHPDTDPHTHYIAFRYNSRPTAQTISFCKNMYGLDRNKYVNYIIDNDNFKMMATVILDFIFRNIIKTYQDKLLIYIGTNEAIAKFYNWIVENYPLFRNNVGIYSSLVSSEEKENAKRFQVILTTTKSAGAAVDIPGLKCSLVLAEPFKSEILTRQTLGRTRASNTYYIEVVDKGFKYCNKYFLDKRQIFQTYAMDSKIVDLSDNELNNLYNKIVKMESPKIKPFTVDINQRIKPFTIGI